MKVYRVEYETNEVKGFKYYVNLKDDNLYGIPVYKANHVDRFTGKVEETEIYLVKKAIKNVTEIDIEFLRQEKEPRDPNKWYLCDYCLEELRSRGEQIFVGEAIYQDPEDIDGIECSWCENITDVVYGCVSDGGK